MKMDLKKILILTVGIVATWYVLPSIILFFIFIYSLFITPSFNSIKSRIFPTPSLSDQTSIFLPLKVSLPGDFKPVSLEQGSSTNNFVVYATTNDNIKDVHNKELFLFDTSGKIITQTPINSQCQTPFTIQGVGLVILYCESQTSFVYQISNSEIKLINKISPFQYDYFSPNRIKHPKINSTGGENTLTQDITYTHTCKDSWGTCYFINASLTINNKKLNIKKYYLHDYIVLNNNKTPMIFGANNTNYNETNELYIFSN